MIDKEERLRTLGKVEAPVDFTKTTIRKLDRIIKTRELIGFVFLVWSEFLILSFTVIESIFKQKKNRL